MTTSLEDLRLQVHAAAVVVMREGQGLHVQAAAPAALADGLVWPPGPLPALTGLVTQDEPLARLVPTSVRLRVGRPTAALLTRTARHALAVLVVWTQAVPSRNAPVTVDELLRSGVESDLIAEAVQEQAQRERTALSVVLAALDSAVVAVDPGHDEVRFNAAAAELLNLSLSATMTEVAHALLRLQDRVLNPDAVCEVAEAVSLAGSISAVLWRFAQPPTHLKVTTRPLRQDAHGARVWVFDDVSTEYDLVEQERQATSRLRITSDAMLDPQVLLMPVRSSDGQIADFVYADVNAACCEYLGLGQDQLLGSSVQLTLPNLRGSGLLDAYADVVRTGEPLVLDDFAFYNDVLSDQRRYDIRAAKAGAGLTLTWRDVTQRFEDARRLQQSEERLAATLDSMLSPHLMLAAVREPNGAIADFVVRDANAAALEYLRTTRQRVIGARLRPGLQPEQFALLFRWCVDVVDRGSRVDLDDVRFPADDSGRDRFVDVKLVRVGDEASFTFRDVTERHQMIERIAESEEHYRLLAQNSSDVVLLIRDEVMIWLSPALTTALGWLPHQWQGLPFLDVVDPADREQARSHVQQVSQGTSEVITVRMPDAAGDAHWIELHSSPYVDTQGAQTGVVGSFRVVDEEVAANEVLDRQARLDELTGLLNRREAMTYLGAVIADGAATGSQVGVLFCDVDGFKQINDGYGHPGGDEVLRGAGPPADPRRAPTRRGRTHGW